MKQILKIDWVKVFLLLVFIAISCLGYVIYEQGELFRLQNERSELRVSINKCNQDVRDLYRAIVNIPRNTEKYAAVKQELDNKILECENKEAEQKKIIEEFSQRYASYKAFKSMFKKK